jgi:hypothetical protein
MSAYGPQCRPECGHERIGAEGTHKGVVTKYRSIATFYNIPQSILRPAVVVLKPLHNYLKSGAAEVGMLIANKNTTVIQC